MNTTATITRSEVFKDGSHKHGGTIFAVNVWEGDTYVDRKYLGVVARRKDFLFKPARTIVSHGMEFVLGGEPEDRRYLVNDWTQPDFVDGKHNDTKVMYFRTRKEAMAEIERIACRISTEIH